MAVTEAVSPSSGASPFDGYAGSGRQSSTDDAEINRQSRRGSTIVRSRMTRTSSDEDDPSSQEREDSVTSPDRHTGVGERELAQLRRLLNGDKRFGRALQKCCAAIHEVVKLGDPAPVLSQLAGLVWRSLCIAWEVDNTGHGVPKPQLRSQVTKVEDELRKVTLDFKRSRRDYLKELVTLRDQVRIIDHKWVEEIGRVVHKEEPVMYYEPLQHLEEVDREHIADIVEEKLKLILQSIQRPDGAAFSLPQTRRDARRQEESARRETILRQECDDDVKQARSSEAALRKRVETLTAQVAELKKRVHDGEESQRHERQAQDAELGTLRSLLTDQRTTLAKVVSEARKECQHIQALCADGWTAPRDFMELPDDLEEELSRPPHVSTRLSISSEPVRSMRPSQHMEVMPVPSAATRMPSKTDAHSLHEGVTPDGDSHEGAGRGGRSGGRSGDAVWNSSTAGSPDAIALSFLSGLLSAQSKVRRELERGLTKAQTDAAVRLAEAERVNAAAASASKRDSKRERSKEEAEMSSLRVAKEEHEREIAALRLKLAEEQTKGLRKTEEMAAMQAEVQHFKNKSEEATVLRTEVERLKAIMEEEAHNNDHHHQPSIRKAHSESLHWKTPTGKVFSRLYKDSQERQEKHRHTQELAHLVQEKQAVSLLECAVLGLAHQEEHTSRDSVASTRWSLLSRNLDQALSPAPRADQSPHRQEVSPPPLQPAQRISVSAAAGKWRGAVRGSLAAAAAASDGAAARPSVGPMQPLEPVGEETPDADERSEEPATESGRPHATIGLSTCVEQPSEDAPSLEGEQPRTRSRPQSAFRRQSSRSATPEVIAQVDRDPSPSVYTEGDDLRPRDPLLVLRQAAAASSSSKVRAGAPTPVSPRTPASSAAAAQATGLDQESSILPLAASASQEPAFAPAAASEACSREATAAATAGDAREGAGTDIVSYGAGGTSCITTTALGNAGLAAAETHRPARPVSASATVTSVATRREGARRPISANATTASFAMRRVAANRQQRPASAALPSINGLAAAARQASPQRLQRQNLSDAALIRETQRLLATPRPGASAPVPPPVAVALVAPPPPATQLTRTCSAPSSLRERERPLRKLLHQGEIRQ